MTQNQYNCSSEINISDYKESTIRTALFIYLKMKNKQLQFQKDNPEICQKRSMKYVEKIKQDPVRYRAMLDKNKDRYWRKKALKEAQKEAEILASAQQSKSILESKAI